MLTDRTLNLETSYYCHSADIMFLTILFDLDGTLVDNTSEMLTAYQEAFAAVEIEYPGDDYLRSLFGMTLAEIIEKLEIPSAKKDEFIKVFRGHDFNYNPDMAPPGMPQLLHELRYRPNGKLGIVTSKSSRTAKETATGVYPGLSFDTFITGDMVSKSKPDAEPILKGLAELGVEPSKKVVYIGDSEHDVESARNAGVTSIAVTWGVHGKTIAEQKPDYLVNTVEELRFLLLVEPSR